MFVAGTAALLAGPLAAGAEQNKPAHIGVLSPNVGPILVHVFRAFRERLSELGYVEGQNLVFEYRFAEGRVDRLPDLAAELIGLGVDVIIAVGPAALKGAKNATAAVPIVAIDLESDPVAAGFVASLARPGGNVTGTFLDQAELSGKWFELLKQINPKLSRVAVFWDSSTPSFQLDAIKAGAKSMRIEVQTLPVGGLPDFEGAFAAAVKGRAQAMVLLSSPLVSNSGPRLANLATARRLATMSMFRENATAGCLMAYGPSLVDGWQRLGSFAGRVLKGIKPADLPVDRPTRFEMVINLRTAKALGLTIPQSLLLRADEVFE